MNHLPILLVEDNDDDATLTMMAFKEAKIANPIVRAHDGAEALTYLLGSEGQEIPPASTLPAVVLLDLNLPLVGGVAVLKQIRAAPRTQFLPVVILTSSDEDRDRAEAYANHANSYVRKPVDYDQFVRASRELGLYWTVTNLRAP
jgi:two-component system, response regulator